MMLKDFRPDMNLMANGKAVRLKSLADLTGDGEWWWVELLFVEPKTELMEFKSHIAYVALHAQRSAA